MDGMQPCATMEPVLVTKETSPFYGRTMYLMWYDPFEVPNKKGLGRYANHRVLPFEIYPDIEGPPVRSRLEIFGLEDVGLYMEGVRQQISDGTDLCMAGIRVSDIQAED